MEVFLTLQGTEDKHAGQLVGSAVCRLSWMLAGCGHRTPQTLKP